MQGFNKYYPPDWDPSKGGLNKYQGKHALGDRARKIDKGILIVRFELPFNIWCGTCNNHIGMGVRYNAEKKKIGNYYSTPIYSFRCKCHLCDGWFEIQTDPKNTAYVVTEDTDKESGNAPPLDPLVALEKTTEAERLLNEVQKPRIESLQSVSEHYNADPYTLSTRVRKRFREDKKVEQKKRAADDTLKGRYGLPSELALVEDDDKAKEEAKEQWLKANQERALRESAKRRRISSEVISIPGSSSTSSSLSSSRATPKAGLSSASSKSNPLASLRARILQNTAAKHSSLAFGSISSGSSGLRKG
ncbi:hypothetical protein D9611_001457 [Ephemerocybe angulata]|uniref:DUF572-domain-containing protein n=1 Tax=Ephemerocybe angulata TaxID=980116 RepID=A0A8H5FMD5_9AGAR|nr:hypothetical protein D9611_001457 [Tulosesus angulatus]